MTGLDWGIVAVYLVAVMAIGIVAGRRQGTTADYFLAARSAPLWAVVGSIIATEVSAATLIAVPTSGYARGFVYLQTTLGAVLSRLLLGWLFIGVFYKANVTTVYEFLGRRYGPGARTAAAGVFLFGRLFASGVRLFIAAVAFHALTGVPLQAAILVAGLAAVVYGTIGGLAADIWTDVIQAVVFLGTGILIAVILLTRIGGPVEAWTAAVAADRTTAVVADFRVWTWAFWANPYTLLGAVVGSCTLGLATHGTDQENVQRMLACKTNAQARRSVVLAGLCDLPVAALFVGIGVLLHVFYAGHPHAYAVEGKDVLVTFVRHELPVGFSGLLVAALFAAAMSSIDSTLNAMSASLVTDFYRPWWRPGRDERHYLRAAQGFSLLAGCALVAVASGAAVYHAGRPATPLIDLALGVMNLFYGSLLGAFLLGLFTRRGTSASIAWGMAAGVATTASLEFALGPLVQACGGPAGLRLGWTWLIVAGTLATVAVGGAVRSPTGAADPPCPTPPAPPSASSSGSRRASSSTTRRAPISVPSAPAA